MKKISLLAFVAVAGGSMAQNFKGHQADFSPINRSEFIQKAGVQEFTGQMHVRPLQTQAWKRLGQTDFGAQMNRIAAETKISDLIIGYIDQLDVYLVKVPQGMTENMLAKELMKTGLYEYVEPNYRVFPTFTPNDPLLGVQWSQTNNQATEAWDICQGNTAITVCVTDTGVHVTHQDLTANRVPGANSATATSTANVLTEGGSGVAVVKDLNGHGTHTTGIAAAPGNNGLGITGVSITGTKHMMIRVSNSAGGSSTLNALSIAALYAAQNGMRVISTSYSGVQNSIFNTTGTTVKSQGAVYCFAAGNDGGTYGASVDWPDVTIVGANSSNNVIASFSARGEFIDVMAPGDIIRSTYWTSDAVNNTYADLSGTSMATPYAAGLAGLIFSQNPNYSAQRVEDILYKSSINQGAAGTYGWGRVNAWNAMGRKANVMTIGPGIQTGGVLADLYRIEGNKVSVKPGIVANITIPPVQIVTEHNVPAYAGNNYGEIDIMSTINITGASGVFSQNLQIWNFATSAYETVATLPVNGSFQEAIKSVNAGNFANYISGGIVRTRTQVYASGPISSLAWVANFDQINVRTLRATQ